MNEQIVKAVNLCQAYHEGKEVITVINGIEFEVKRGDLVAITGRSGSGKSTLLYLLAGLERSSSGKVYIEGVSLQEASANRIAYIRNHRIGFVYQFHHLLQAFSAVENVAMPLLIAGASLSEAKARAMRLLERVGLEARALHFPNMLSGGERQRVAVARALINDPAVVLADEPTGNLDQENSRQILGLIQSLNAELKTTFLIATHDTELARCCRTRWLLSDGRLQTVYE